MQPSNRPSLTIFCCALLLVLAGVGIAAGAEPAATTPAPADGVVVFYFHGNVRCATCRTIEAYAGEAVRDGFAADLASGAIAWREVNVDSPEHRHFIQDFRLTTRSVVLAEYRGGQVVRHQSLDKVWQLVRSKDRFVDYIQGETRAFLEAG